MIERLAARLQHRHEQGLYRQRRVGDDPAKVVFDSNDYLGLANHPQVIAAMAAAVNRYGVGSGGSHLICGHHHEHKLLEEELAAFVGRDRALLFSSGYMANIGVMQALLESGDVVVADRLNHASLIDAVRLSGAQHNRYQHADVASANRQLSLQPKELTLLVTEGVFSMDGDLAPLSELAELAKQHQTCMMVDDAHGFGVLGATGAGSLEAAGLTQQQVPVLMATLGKAAGQQGAFVAGSEALIEGLIQFARTYVYTTALPPAVAAASRVSLQLIAQESWRRQKLTANIERFTVAAQQLGLALLPSTTPIQGVIAGSNQRVSAWAEQLQLDGFAVTAIRAPTVTAGTERLRIALSAVHTDTQIDRLVDRLGQVVGADPMQTYG